MVFDQAETARLIVLAGPVLDLSDRVFLGLDDLGRVRVQIPARYWKVIVANMDGGLRVFPFLLDQDLSDVPLEFQVSTEWQARQTSLRAIEDATRIVTFPPELHRANPERSEPDRDDDLLKYQNDRAWWVSPKSRTML